MTAARLPHFIRVLTTLACLALIASPGAAADPRDQPWLGHTRRDTPDGPVVSWIFPGPLGGRSYTSETGVRRGDNFVSLDAEPLDAVGFHNAIVARSPGDTVTLVLRRSPQAVHDGAVPKGGPGGEPYTVTAVLASRHDWTGTVGRGAPDRTIPEPAEGAFEAMILADAAEHAVLDADGGLNPLMTNLRGVQDAAMDPNALDAVVNVFRRPLSIDAQEAAIDERVRNLQHLSRSTDPTDWPDLMRAAAAMIHAEPGPDDADGSDAEAAAVADAAYTVKARGLVRHLRDNISVGGPQAGKQINVIGNSEQVLRAVLSRELERFRATSERIQERLDRATAGDAIPLDRAVLPEPLAAAVSGDVVAFWPVGDRFGVVTGPGSNRLDMAVVAEAIDLGGDDQYIWPADLHERPAAAHGNHVLIDLGGSDTYESLAETAGPGAGVFGFSIIDDRAGDDTYRSARLGSIGLGLFGIGILIDRAGDDRYENLGPDSGWSTGVGFYGVGLVIDHAGQDVYHAEKLSQGVGGPRGFGAVLDAGGNDRYEANGPNFTSAYGTPDVFLGMSQGFGFGIRSYAAGGVGAIYDDAGDDEYNAGEFSQAGGYYFGLGILHDRDGADRYHGNRYGQAFAAHQAAGILVDDAGDDSYWSMTAASQSGVWDQSVTMLIDRAGDDTYRADGLALGAASMQAIGVFLDLAGADRYEAPAGATLGQSGGNAYHYDADGVFSFSAFFDLGGGDDTYPAHRGNNQSRPTGVLNEASPKDSGLHGIFVDR